jgi:hypothetical protein
MTKKKTKYKNIINKIIDSNFRGIVLSSVRSGKILLSAMGFILKRLTKKLHILVLYPNIDIKKVLDR